MVEKSLPDRLYLVGLMGSGKSTVGHLLAKRLGYTFLDLDTVIEQQQDQSIGAIFATAGEAHFRSLEQQALRDTLDRSRLVVACGGGVVLAPENRELLQRETTVWLEVTPQTAAIRLADSDDRPLLQADSPVEILRRLEQERRALYEAVARLAVNSERRSPDEIAEAIIINLKNRVLLP